MAQVIDLKSLRQQLARDRNQDADTRIRLLILMLSPPTTVPAVKGYNDDSLPCHARFLKQAGTAEYVDLDGRGALAADIHKLDGLRHNWQQLLRAILPHADRLSEETHLEQVWLLGSLGYPPREAAKKKYEEGKFQHGSGAYLELCRDFLAPYLPGVTIHFDRKYDTNFESFDQLFTMLKRLRTSAFGGFPPRTIAFDITGGIKIASVAGAILTLNDLAVCQYVSTIEDPDGQPGEELQALIYDLVHEQIPALPS